MVDIGGGSFLDTSAVEFDPSTRGSMLTRILDLTRNPNVLKGMAQLGAGMSNPGSFGDVGGRVTAGYIENKAVQEAEAKLASNRAGMNTQLQELLAQQKMLSGAKQGAEMIESMAQDNGGKSPGLAENIIDSIKADPFGENSISDSKDHDGVNGWTVDNGNVTLKMNNPYASVPKNQYKNLQDSPVESTTLRSPLKFGADPTPDITAGITAGDVFGLDVFNSPNSKLDARRDLPGFFNAPKD